jgi:hypothetical protein
MLRAAHLPRSHPTVLNLLLVSKRWQQTTTSPGSGTTGSTKSTPSSTTTTQTASTKPSFNAPIDRTNNPYKTTTAPTSSYIPPSSSRTGPPPSFSAPPTGKSGGSSTAIKAIVYSVALGLTATLVYAEYENGPFRRQLESTVPFSSTILGGLDQVIEPVFGRKKSLTTQISEKMPDLSYVKDKIPDKDQTKTLGQQVKNTVNNTLEKLPDKTQIKKAGEQVKGAVDHATNQVQSFFHQT